MKALFVFLSIILLIVFHEFGHFIAGRIFKIPVEEFSIGFGPLLFQKQGKRETKWSLRAFPLGGYCAFADEVDNPNVLTLDKVHPLKRIMVFLAGPFMNFITCYVLIFLVCAVVGAPLPTLVVDSTIHGYPIYGQLQENDKILSVNGEKIDNPNVLNEKLTATPSFVLEVEREGKRIEIESELKVIDEKNKIYDTGIIFKQEPYRVPIRRSFYVSAVMTRNYATQLLDNLRQMVTGKTSINSMSSLVGIVNVVSNYAKPEQLSTLLLYFALISINLCVINLLPIPGLDGSHILMDVVTLVTRKKVPEKAFYWATVVSFALLIAFAFVLMVKDTMGVLGL